MVQTLEDIKQKIRKIICILDLKFQGREWKLKVTSDR